MGTLVDNPGAPKPELEPVRKDNEEYRRFHVCKSIEAGDLNAAC